jgi:hypothetical protein
MMDQARSRASPLDGHSERGDGELGAHVVAHGPTDHLAGEEIEDHGQVEPPLAGRDVGNVGQPDLIGPVGHKILIQQVWRHRQGMLAVGRAHAIAAWRSSPDTMLAHHPLDPLTADGLALGTQLGMDARRTISFPVVSMNAPDIVQQRAIGNPARALRP